MRSMPIERASQWQRRGATRHRFGGDDDHRQGRHASVLAFRARFGLIGAIIGLPIAAALQIVVEELTAGRRACIATADAAERTR